MKMRFKPLYGVRFAWARLAVLALLVAGLAACGGSGDGSASARELAGPGGQASGLHGDTLSVDLADFYFVLPDTLPAGDLHLIARNVGVEYHNFEVYQDGELLWSFDSDVPPMRTAEAVLSLEPGDYFVSCAVGSHESQGMFTFLTVVDSAAP
jgi:hypothetical protein